MKSDEEFIAELKKSVGFVEMVAEWLKLFNYDVTVIPTQIRPDFESRAEYVDEGDIEIRHKIQVKHRNDLDFTSANDYPYRTVFFDEKFKVDRMPKNRLWAYVVLNKRGTHACVVDAKTRSKWEIIETYDKKDGRQITVYAIDKKYCKFYELQGGN